MINTNLSTRPFYNARAVTALLAVLSAIVFAVTAYNVVQLISLTGSQRTLGAKASACMDRTRSRDAVAPHHVYCPSL